MRTISVAISIAALTMATNAIAETQAERDARRSSYIAGLSCSFISSGQPMTVRYNAGGTGRLEWQEDDAALSWSIEKDVFCVQATGGRKSCSNLGSNVAPNEEETFKKQFLKSCM